MKPAPQSGILNRPPDQLMMAAYNLSAADAPTATAILERLRLLFHHELRSNLDETTPASAKDQPSAETGELGFSDRYDRYHLTITLGLGLGAFEKLSTAADQVPQDLRRIDWTQLGDVDAQAPQASVENGDLALQVCSDSAYINEHVLRRVGEELGDVLTPVWTVAGQQRHTSRAGRANRDEGRALIGFLDGTSNLKPQHDPEAAKLVFVDPDPAVVASYPPREPAPLPVGEPNPYNPTVNVGPVFPPDLHDPPTSEPAWTKHGSYMVARTSTFDAQAWDHRALGDQERTIGRFKVSGQPLSQPDDPNAPILEPDFSTDPAGTSTPLNSHIRKVNPRGPGDEQRRIFRRGYPLIAAPGPGGLIRGLVFICFGRTITTQFEFITRAWTTNPNFPSPEAGNDALRAIETVLCGGYYFAPPLTNAAQPWSFSLPPLAT